LGADREWLPFAGGRKEERSQETVHGSSKDREKKRRRPSVKEGGRVPDIDHRHLEGGHLGKACGEKGSVSAWIFMGENAEKKEKPGR
jgi:hypothetical protein